ncbi:MAG: HupE / UreJ protein [Bacteroidetes bacterium]|nr:HupE / UreJ protein [Bacteroidota bacterium]
MNNFSLWFTTGVGHITDFEGYDHMLFLLALCGVYTINQWKSLLVLITAFTIGHSVTLALSVLDIFSINTKLVEFLIPVTILSTCVYNIYNRNKIREGNFKANYWMALFFGLIHGLGFSTLLKSLLGSQKNILSPLFAFNTGIEAGQLIIVTTIVLFSLFLTSIFRIRQVRFNFFISVAVFGIALLLAAQRFYDLIH